MRTPRIVSSRAAPEDGVLSVSGEPFIHLARVLRRSVGDQVEIVFKGSATYRAEILAIEANCLSLKLLDLVELAQVSKLTVFCGICKPKTLDFITSKAVELAISNLCFFQGDRSQESLKASKIAERLERLERVADAAIKQSGAQSERLCITICNNLASALKLFHLENDVSFQESRLLMQTPRSLDRQAPTILQYFTIPPDSLRNDLKITDSSLQSTPKPAESYLVIGPEGGLSAHEETLASEQYHYLPVSLGPKTLRVETAVIAAGSIAGLAQMRK